MAKTPHPYADILRAIADGETVQWKPQGCDWQDLATENGLLAVTSPSPVPVEQLRVKPRTIRVGEVDVPEPTREALAVGSIYWIASHFLEEYASQNVCRGDRLDRLYLERGACYENEADAKTAGRAIATLFQAAK